MSKIAYLNNRPYEIEPGETMISFARRSLGIEIFMRRCFLSL